MFTASADLYDLIYSGMKDYPAETSELVTTIRRLHPSARTVLDVACGTGEHARLLTEHGFEVDGLDINPAFVQIARRKLAGSVVYEGDMTSFALGKRYDVILCLFSAIGYVKTLENVRLTLGRFHEHLAEAGRLSRVRFEYLIGRASGLEHMSEVHELGLFTTEEMLECFRQSGFKATHDSKGPTGRGLFLATAA